MVTRFLLLVAGHILGQHLPSFSTELVSSNYHVGDVWLQHFASENKFGGHGAFSTIALASPTSQSSLLKVPTALIPCEYEVNSTEKLESSLTAIWQVVTVDNGGNSVTTLTGETSEFETPAFYLFGDLSRFASLSFFAIFFLMEIGIISTIFLCGLCGMHRRIPRKKRRRLHFNLAKKCRNRRFKTINELKAVIQNGVDSGRVMSKLNRKSKSKSNRKSKSKLNRKSMSKLYRKLKSKLNRKSKSNRKLNQSKQLCLSASECITNSICLLSLRILV